MTWHTIDNQADLENLDRQICWEDSESVEYYATNRNEDWFPSDVSRSGYIRKNVHILCRVLQPRWGVFGDGLDPLRRILCSIRRSSLYELKRVEVLDCKGSLKVRCSRLVYRFVQEDQVSEGYYFQKGSEHE